MEVITMLSSKCPVFSVLLVLHFLVLKLDCLVKHRGTFYFLVF